VKLQRVLFPPKGCKILHEQANEGFSAVFYLYPDCDFDVENHFHFSMLCCGIYSDGKVAMDSETTLKGAIEAVIACELQHAAVALEKEYKQVKAAGEFQ